MTLNYIDDIADGLRQGMRCLASGVCVISGVSEDGERAAMTVSSVTSVSDSPASLLVCINQSARMDYILKHSDQFCINILGAEHQSLSEICATPDTAEERFNMGVWQSDGKTGLPYVADAPAVFICSTEQVVAHGTHSVFIGDVQSVRVSPEEQPALVYADGKYHYL